MKILYIVGFHPDIGGPFSIVKNLKKHLYRLGCKVGVCSVLSKRYNNTIEGCDFFEDLIMLKTDKIISRFWASYTKELTNYIHIFEKYDLIHLHGIFDYYSFFVYKFTKKPYIVSPHGTLLREVISKKNSLVKKLHLLLIGKRILNNAEFVHVLTEDEGKSLSELGIESPVKLIPNAIDPDEFKNLPPKRLLFDKFPYLQNKKIVLFLSRIDWKKGLDDLIPAFFEVKRKINNVHLLIVGPDTTGYIKKVFEWIEEFKLTDDVTYIGPAYGSDKLMFLQDSDIFVLPSYSEGFPMAVIEAMYMGLPVVVTDSIGIQDIINKYQCGIMVNKRREEISQAILKLVGNPEQAKSMGMKGKESIIANFLWDKVAGEYVKMYEGVLEGRKVERLEG